MPSNPAQRRYVIRMVVAAALCVLFSVVAAASFLLGHIQGVLAYLVAVLPAFPIMGALVGTGLYLAEEKDEFQRELLIQSLLGGIGATLSATTIWGFLEDFTHVPHLDLIWVYPIFWLFVGLSMPFVWMRYR
jgi:hypothetical protein